VSCVKSVFSPPSEQYFRAFAARPPMLHYKWLEVGREMRTYSFDCYRQLVAHVKTLPPLPGKLVPPKPAAVKLGAPKPSVVKDPAKKSSSASQQRVQRPLQVPQRARVAATQPRTVGTLAGAGGTPSEDRVIAGAHELKASLVALLRRIPPGGVDAYPPPWVDAYLDQLLIRAVYVRFGQCPLYKPLGKAVGADIHTKWSSVSVLLSRSVGECMLRYLQLLMGHVREAAAKHELIVQLQVAQPASSTTWQGYPAAANSAALLHDNSEPSLLSLGITGTALNPESFAVSCAAADEQMRKEKVTSCRPFNADSASSCSFPF
jgi:hypothetical protein